MQHFTIDIPPGAEALDPKRYPFTLELLQADRDKAVLAVNLEMPEGPAVFRTVTAHPSLIRQLAATRPLFHQRHAGTDLRAGRLEAVHPALDRHDLLIEGNTIAMRILCELGIVQDRQYVLEVESQNGPGPEGPEGEGFYILYRVSTIFGRREKVLNGTALQIHATALMLSRGLSHHGYDESWANDMPDIAALIKTIRTLEGGNEAHEVRPYGPAQLLETHPDSGAIPSESPFEITLVFSTRNEAEAFRDGMAGRAPFWCLPNYAIHAYLLSPDTRREPGRAVHVLSVINAIAVNVAEPFDENDDGTAVIATVTGSFVPAH